MSLSPEQLAARKLSIGSSEVAAAVGLNPWRTQHQLWLLKRGLVEEEPSKQTRVGELIEPIIAQMYCEETGSETAHFGTIAHPEHEWVTATPDLFVSGAKRVVEIKCVGWRSALHWTNEPDGIPDYYRTQAEWEMLVTGADECDVAALIGGTDFRIYRIRRDDALCAKLFERAKRFWFDHVVTDIPPEPDGSEGAREMLTRIFPRSLARLKPASPDAELLASQLIIATSDRKKAEEKEAALENKMRQCIGDDEGIKGTGWRATWKSTKAGTRQFLFKVKEAS